MKVSSQHYALSTFTSKDKKPQYLFSTIIPKNWSECDINAMLQWTNKTENM